MVNYLALFRAWWAPGALAVAALGVTTLAMIRFDLGAFLRVFFAHRQLRGVGVSQALPAFWKQATAQREAALVLPVVALLVAALAATVARRRQVEPGRRALVFASAVAAAACVFLYVSTATPWVVLLAFCAGFALASGAPVPPGWRLPAQAALLGLFGFNQALWIVDVGGRRFPDAAALRAARAAAGSAGQLVVDSSTARYVFDFKLPADTACLDYLVSPFRPDGRLRLEEKSPGAAWVVTPPFLKLYLDRMPATLDAYPRVSIGQHPFSSLPLRPDEPLVLTGELE